MDKVDRDIRGQKTNRDKDTSISRMNDYKVYKVDQAVRSFLIEGNVCQNIDRKTGITSR